MFHGDGKCVEEDQNDDKPIKPLLFDCFPNQKAHFLLINPKVGILLELFL